MAACNLHLGSHIFELFFAIDFARGVCNTLNT
jgi:hypothetical protein